MKREEDDTSRPRNPIEPPIIHAGECKCNSDGLLIRLQDETGSERRSAAGLRFSLESQLSDAMIIKIGYLL